MKNLIKKVKDIPVVTTYVIADEFGRDHFRVMNSIDSLIMSNHLGSSDFRASSYISKQNKELPCYELTERGFLIAMPFIGGNKAKDGQVRLVDSFIEFRKIAEKEAKTKAERELARMEYRPMTDAIKKLKEDEGKEPKHYHFSNEADMINRVVLGKSAAKFKSEHNIDKKAQLRDCLTPDQIKSITELQRANTVFITCMNWDYEQRKNALIAAYQNNQKNYIKSNFKLNN
ncbi:Rha family transcriptional regulator [Arsenophonus sp. aPb]|uniref:Rha family transcriptional regulator n=1 Tax=Arsenophonus sp. aPb TaxID=3041619 RepID=UPI0024693726|nr:Rha family transcriptional regulator [Arsenophonus sp. aPb]WGL99152.1 Rha family transcriptional regulator [Arsenophonus sp. aPb]